MCTPALSGGQRGMHEEQGKAGRGENKNFMEAENPA